MKNVVNSQTGLEEVQFSAKLISVSENELERTNSAGETKYFRVATIEFVDDNGEVQTTSAVINSANYNYGMQIGESYLATARTDTGVNAQPGDVIINVSHLKQSPVAPRAKATMFGAVFTNRLSEVTA